LFGIDKRYVKRNIEEWTTAVQEVANGYETGVYGLIDGKLFFTTNLMWCKKALYSGKHHRPGLKFQTIIAPNGLLIHAYGPVSGRAHDANVLRQSGVLAPLRQLYDWGVQHNPANYNPAVPLRGINVYGDSAYPKRSGMFSAYKTIQLSAVPARAAVQDGLNEARAEMEHFYSNLILNWRGISNPLEMKNGKRPVAHYILSTLFFQNCYVCAEGSSQTSIKFGVSPPVLRAFLAYCVDRERRNVVP
jgi:hypothetical protein